MTAKSQALLNQNIIESILILSNFYLPHPQQGRPTIELLSLLPQITKAVGLSSLENDRYSTSSEKKPEFGKLTVIP